MSRSLPWIAALATGCAHGSTTPKLQPAPDTAVGAYIRAPAPYQLASLAACSFDGPIASDLRATAPGPITAHCPDGATFRWNAVVANGLTIDGPPAIQLRHGVTTSYAYSAIYTAGSARVAGDARFKWGLGPGCGGVAELNDFGDGTLVAPTAPGQCVLLARDPQGRTAELAITIEASSDVSRN
jgi:hypothetical protein